MSGPPPFGMRWLAGDLVPQPAEVGIVSELVEAFIAAGGRMKPTADALNAKGFMTRRGSLWTDVAVARVLHQEGLHELVPENLWRRCEGLLAEREGPTPRPGRRSAHPLGSVVRCRCSGTMYLRGEALSAKYVCQDCRSKLPYQTLERTFLESLAQVAVSAQEVAAEMRDDPRAAEVRRAVPDRDVSLAEIWPTLDPAERRQLVDVLIGRIEVGEDEIRVVLAISDRFQAETEASQPNSSPSSRDLRTLRQTATRRTEAVREQRDAELPSPLSSQPRVAPKAYRIQQVAELLNLPKSTVYDLVRTGALSSVRTGSGNGGGVVLVPASAVTEFLESKRRRR
jgi:excisionase family DNA binding protein